MATKSAAHNTHIYLTYLSFVAEVWTQLSRLLLNVFIGCNPVVSQASLLFGALGSSSKLTWLLAEFSSLELQTNISIFLVTIRGSLSASRGCPQFLAKWSPHRASHTMAA